MKKKLFSIIMCILMVMCFMPMAAFAVEDLESNNSEITEKWIDAVSTQPEGYAVDTEQKFVTISSAEGLAWFAKQINSVNTKLTGDDACFKGYTINITENIDLSGKLWIPIDPDTVDPNGASDRASDFGNNLLNGATINGNNHTITGMTIHNTVRGPKDGAEEGQGQSCCYYAGFIGRSKGSLTIKNLNFVNASVDAHNEPKVSTAGSSSLAVVLACNTGTLTCENVNIDNCTLAGHTKIGGFTGQDSGTLSLTKCSVTNCTIKLETYVGKDGKVTPTHAAPISGFKKNVQDMSIMGVKSVNNTITLDEEFKNYPVGKYYYYTDGDWNLIYADTVYWAGYIYSDGVNKDTTTIDGKSQPEYGREFCLEAEINGYAYASLNDAINAAQDGDTVNILTDCNIEPIEIGYEKSWTKGITIEGNGHTVTGWETITNDAGNYLAIDVYGKVAFSNIKFTNFGCGESALTMYGSVIHGCDGCNITIKNCSFKNFNRQAIKFDPSTSAGSMTIEGCTFECAPFKDAFTLQKGITMQPRIEGCIVKIKDSEIKDAGSSVAGWSAGGIDIYGGTLSVENCKMTNCEAGILAAREYFENNNVDIDITLRSTSISARDTAIWISAYKNRGNDTTAKVSIESGSYIGVYDSVASGKMGWSVENTGTDEDLAKCTFSISAGTFSTDPSQYLASSRHYTVKNEAEGTWTVYRYSSSGSSSTTTTDNVTNTTETTKTDAGATTTVPETKATVKAETKTAADGTKTTTATVDTTTATKIVEKAVENKSEVVVVSAAATPVAETAAGTTTEVAIPAETISQISEKTEAAVTIESEAAKVTLDKQAVAAVAEQAGETGSVKLVVETVAQDASKVEVEIKLETSNGAVSDFKGGSVIVTVKLNSALAGKEVTCVYIDDNGNYHKVAGIKSADGTFTFITGHFSTYAIMSVEEADAVIADQTAKVKDLVSNLSLKASSTKTKNGNIKVNLKVSSSDIKEIEEFGYTVKYKFYRSTKKASGYKAMLEKAGKTYTNTTGKKGTRYYYKARVMVYDSEGAFVAKTVLTQCKYATRIK